MHLKQKNYKHFIRKLLQPSKPNLKLSQKIKVELKADVKRETGVKK